MSNYLSTILLGQYEASLCMLRETLVACPEEQWTGKIAFLRFGEAAYHVLFFTDYYLTQSEAAFELRELNVRGGDERKVVFSPGLSRAETIEYLDICRKKMQETIAAETQQSLEAPARFERRNFSRGELHIYNIRHVQHHAAQMSAYLRRIGAAATSDAPTEVKALADLKALPWVASGWR